MSALQTASFSRGETVGRSVRMASRMGRSNGAPSARTRAARSRSVTSPTTRPSSWTATDPILCSTMTRAASLQGVPPSSAMRSRVTCFSIVAMRATPRRRNVIYGRAAPRSRGEARAIGASAAPSSARRLGCSACGRARARWRPAFRCILSPMPRAISTQARLRRDLVETCRRLHARDLIGAGEGNVSCRLDQDRLLVTPSGANKAYLRPADLVVVTAAGERVRGRGRPSTELRMHLAAYLPPPNALVPEASVTLGEVAVAPFATPGTEELPRVLAPLLARHDVLLLARH